MKGIRLPELLLGIINTQDPESVDYQIARYILQHTKELDRINVRELATQCQVSNASISRFCRRIGLEDYLDLQMLTRSYRRDAGDKFYYHHYTSPKSDFLDESIFRIEQMKRNMDEQFLKTLVKEIHDYEHVAAFGHMQSGNISLILQHDLTACGKLIDGSHVYQQQKEYIKNAGSDTLILVFSVQGGFFQRLFADGNFLNQANKPKIYMFTLNEQMEKPSYISKIIPLCPIWDFAGSVLIFVAYASLISRYYYESYVQK